MGFFSGASNFVHRNTATLRQSPNITIPTMNDIKRDVGNIATGNVGEIIDRNTDSVNPAIADPIREESNRITAAHHTNVRYMREAALGLLGGGLPDTTMNYTTTNNPTDNEGGTRGTASGGATGASGKSSTATRVIREKNKPVASMITQQKNLKKR